MGWDGMYPRLLLHLEHLAVLTIFIRQEEPYNQKSPKSVGAWACASMSEKLCLKWNDFQENVNSAFGNLREDNEFADVTLACEDGQQIEAHKVILAASSPFFQTLLKRNKHPHPLI